LIATSCPYFMIHMNVMRGSRERIRESVQLARRVREHHRRSDTRHVRQLEMKREPSFRLSAG